jgi:hypothetical protein
MDPIWNTLCCLCKGKDYCGSFKRYRQLDECNDKFSEEMDIINILKKIRDADSILKHLMNKDDKNIVKISKE